MCCLQGRVGLDARAARSLQNSAMHLRKACAQSWPHLALLQLKPERVMFIEILCTAAWCPARCSAMCTLLAACGSPTTLLQLKQEHCVDKDHVVYDWLIQNNIALPGHCRQRFFLISFKGSWNLEQM